MQQEPSPVGRIDVHFPQSYYRVPVNVRLNGELVFRDEKFGGEVPVPPGCHTVTCDSRHRGWRRFGEASLTVDVGPGQIVPVFYAPPHTIVSKPAIGFTPQQRHFNLTVWGWVALIAVVTLPVLFAVIK